MRLKNVALDHLVMPNRHLEEIKNRCRYKYRNSNRRVKMPLSFGSANSPSLFSNIHKATGLPAAGRNTLR